MDLKETGCEDVDMILNYLRIVFSSVLWY